MQQVFNVMNTLLKSYKETKRRKLTIRTYKVITSFNPKYVIYLKTARTKLICTLL